MKLIIDRFEGDLAVLTVSDDEAAPELHIFRSYLPANCKPGHHLTIFFQHDTGSESRTRQNVAQLLQDLIIPNDPNDPNNQNFQL
jgi:Protein of unknown function (DUF3006)